MSSLPRSPRSGITYAPGSSSAALTRQDLDVLLSRAMRRFRNQLPVCTRADVDCLLDGVFQHLDLEEFRCEAPDIIETLISGLPVIAGQSHIGCTVEGPVVLRHVQLRRGGLITGCGALLMPEVVTVPDGSIILLHHGQVITTVAELQAATLGTIYDPDTVAMN